MRIILHMNVDLSNDLFNFIVLLEQLCRLYCGAAWNLDSLDQAEALRDDKCKVGFIVFSVKDSRNFA